MSLRPLLDRTVFLIRPSRTQSQGYFPVDAPGRQGRRPVVYDPPIPGILPSDRRDQQATLAEESPSGSCTRSLPCARHRNTRCSQAWRALLIRCACRTTRSQSPGHSVLSPRSFFSCPTSSVSVLRREDWQAENAIPSAAQPGLETEVCSASSTSALFGRLFAGSGR